MNLAVENLTKRYAEQTAIDHINFSLEAGETVGFLGPNGAGKSTTLKIITGYLPPTSGMVKLGQYHLADHSLEIRQHIGYLAESNPLYLDMYVHELLRFVGKIYGIKGKKLTARIAEIIEMTGLVREQHKKIEALSKGYRKRVGLAVALIHDPAVLILDEPTDGLDVFQVVEIRNLIQSFGGKKTILFSSHILSEVEALAKRVIIINKGKILADHSIKELADSLQNERIIRIETDKPGFNLKAIENHPSVLNIEVLSPVSFIVHASAKDLDTDLRKFIYDECVRQNFTLLSLSKDETGLEELFKQITGKNS